MDETSYKSHNMIFICSDEGEWSVKVNIVNEIAYFCIHCCLKIGKTIPIYSENNITSYDPSQFLRMVQSKGFLRPAA